MVVWGKEGNLFCPPTLHTCTGHMHIHIYSNQGCCRGVQLLSVLSLIELKPDCSNKGVAKLKQDIHDTEFKILQEVSLAAERSEFFLLCTICFYLLKAKICAGCELQLPLFHLQCFYPWFCFFLLPLLSYTVFCLLHLLLFNSLFLNLISVSSFSSLCVHTVSMSLQISSFRHSSFLLTLLFFPYKHSLSLTPLTV